ncbi:MAG: SH3 domain-containing protein [Anaerolineales bacterium]|nr:SH3 domain-containing protein [Anaerolineales bacterium]
MTRWLGLTSLIMFVAAALLIPTAAPSSAAPALQATATLRVTAEGPVILVPDQVNVRTGPGTEEYEIIGVLISGQRAPALGRSPGGDWIQISYPGVEGGVAWVYAPLVTLEGQGFLPVIEPPPTPTPRVTATIDPTLAAQFNLLDITPTRMPTFTPADPIVQPTFASGTHAAGGRGFPPALAIIGLFVVGMFGTVISVLRGG